LIKNILADNKGSIYSVEFKCAVFDILYKTGLRVDELLSLSNNNIDRENNVLRVIGKGNKERFIPIHETILMILLDDSFYKILQKLSSGTIWYWTKKYFGKDFSPHSFRHGFTTRLIKKGLKERAIMSVLGHSSYTTTLRYFHENRDETHKEIIKALS